MKKLLLLILFIFPLQSYAGYLFAQGEIYKIGAMSSSTGYDHWLTIKNIDNFHSCRQATDMDNLVLFRIKREEGEKEIYSTALTAFSTKIKVMLLVNTGQKDQQGNCYISGIYLGGD